MRILLVHRYFWPDTPPYASILLEIAKHLVNQGHQVEVVTSFPSYKSQQTIRSAPSIENIDGITIRRVKLLTEHKKSVLFKAFNLIYFPIRVLFHQLFNPKIEVAMCSTVPAVMMGLFCSVGAKITHSKFIYHCMDLHPEVGRISGEFKNPVLYKMLKWLDTLTCKLANQVVVLSTDMKHTLVQRKLDENKIEVLNNFPLPMLEAENQLDASLLKNESMFRILFAGNIGRFQNLEAFIEAMQLLREKDDIELVFVGEGAMLEKLKSMRYEAGLANIQFIPHQTVAAARRLMADADLGIVSLEQDVYKYAFPSKTMTYLEEGCKLLISVEVESSLHSMVAENNLGYCAQPKNPQSIADAISAAYANSSAERANTQVTQNYVLEHFAKEKILNRWSMIFASLEHAK